MVASQTNFQFFTNASNAEKEQLRYCSTGKLKVSRSCFFLGNVFVGTRCFSGTVAMEHTSPCNCLHIFTEEVPDP